MEVWKDSVSCCNDMGATGAGAAESAVGLMFCGGVSFALTKVASMVDGDGDDCVSHENPTVEHC